MALTAGARLGHYNVTALFGEGGMEQVWQATDTQLNCQVALTILRDPFAADLDRLAKGPIPVDEALPIAKQNAKALEAPREAGVSHRDLKPMDAP
jgi:serine/threonine protein kinase